MLSFNPDRQRLLLAAMSPFWGDVDTLEVLTAIGMLSEQNTLTARESLATINRFVVPDKTRKLWRLLDVPEDEITRLGSPPLTYGGGRVYGQESTLYGSATDGPYLLPLPAGVSAVELIVDRLLSPSVVWVAGVDYEIENGQIVCDQNPLDHFPTHGKMIETGQILAVVRLWCVGVKQAPELPHRHFGHVVGLGPSAPRRAINAFWNTLQSGSNSQSFRDALAAMCGVETVSGTNETVDTVIRGADRTQVVTNRAVYDLPVDSTVTAVTGTMLFRGDIPTTDLRVVNFADLAAQTADLPALALEPWHMDPPLTACLLFPNREVPLVVSVDGDGKTLATFELGGRDQDISAFWEKAAAAPADQTVAQALRLDDGGGQPPPSRLPATVNPMHFLLNTVWRGGLTLVVARLEKLPGTSGRDLLSLKSLLPAHTALLVVAPLDVPTEYNAVEGDSGGTEASIEVITAQTVVVNPAETPVISMQ